MVVALIEKVATMVNYPRPTTLKLDVSSGYIIGTDALSCIPFEESESVELPQISTIKISTENFNAWYFSLKTKVSSNPDFYP